MHIDRLHIRLADRRRASALARFNPSICYARLSELAFVLDGQPWMVVSGLVEPLTKGGFSRAHSDIDIAIPQDCLENAAAALLRAGFVLTTRIFRTHLNRDYDIEAHLRIGSGPLLQQCRRLRLWRLTVEGDLDETAVPSYIDVFPYVLMERKMWILDGGPPLDIRRPLALKVAIPGGITIPVEDPYYVDALRRSRYPELIDDESIVIARPGASGVNEGWW